MNIINQCWLEVLWYDVHLVYLLGFAMFYAQALNITVSLDQTNFDPGNATMLYLCTVYVLSISDVSNVPCVDNTTSSPSSIIIIREREREKEKRRGEGWSFTYIHCMVDLMFYW